MHREVTEEAERGQHWSKILEIANNEAVPQWQTAGISLRLVPRVVPVRADSRASEHFNQRLTLPPAAGP